MPRRALPAALVVAPDHTLRGLAGVILQGNVNMQLPNLWLWEMVDEFIYQFQSFCTYRGKLAMKSPEEVEKLKECDQARARRAARDPDTRSLEK